MKNVSACIFGITTACTAFALPVMPILRWEVSTDGGVRWANNATLIQPGAVQVRAQLSWTETPTGPTSLGLASCQFDGVLNGLISSDIVSDILILNSFPGEPQTLAFTNYGVTGKIDDVNDTAYPNSGVLWCKTGQAPPQLLGPLFNSNNPITVMTYTFHITGEDRRVSLGAILNGSANSAARVYLTEAGSTTNGGQFRRSEVIVETALVETVPAPASISLISAASILASRRRR